MASCNLGSTTCAGVDVSSSGLFSTAYIYREGIVSFDSRLPTGATSADLASLGNVNFFAPGFNDAANYQVNMFVRIGEDAYGGYNAISAFTFNFYEQGEPLFYSDDETGEVFTDLPYAPSLQVQLFGLDAISNADGTFNGVGLAAGYEPSAAPLSRALIGFNYLGVSQTVRNEGNLLIGSAAGDTDVFTQTTFDAGRGPEPLLDSDGNYRFDEDGNLLFDDGIAPHWSIPTHFTALYASAPGVPEPASWIMMLAGFIGGGAALRRSRRKAIVQPA